MNWTLFLTTFLTIFVAEMGDKTQMAAVAASAQSKGAWEVAAAVALALMCAGLLGVLAGRFLAEWINPVILKSLAGGLFILMGIFMLWKR